MANAQQQSDDEHFATSDHVVNAARDMFEALRLHVAYQAMPNDRNGDDAKALAFGRFLTARDEAMARAEGVTP